MKKIFLIRHGQTLWSMSGQHTSYTDLGLTDHGVLEVMKLKAQLPRFAHVWISPLKRARQTADLLSLHGVVMKELVEWNYGVLEGLTTKEIQEKEKDWNIFTHGALYGETLMEVEERAKRVLSLLSHVEGPLAIVSSGHFIRALITQSLRLPLSSGQFFEVDTGSYTIIKQTGESRFVLETLNRK
jgi:broad specificity phosphatase PhoE